MPKVPGFPEPVEKPGLYISFGIMIRPFGTTGVLPKFPEFPPDEYGPLDLSIRKSADPFVKPWRFGSCPTIALAPAWALGLENPAE